MIYPMLAWYLCLFLRGTLPGLAAPMEFDAAKDLLQVAEGSHAASDAQKVAHVPVPAELLHGKLPQASVGLGESDLLKGLRGEPSGVINSAEKASKIGEGGLGALRGESSIAVHSTEPTSLTRSGKAVLEETGIIAQKWQEVEKQPIPYKIWSIGEYGDLKNFPRFSDEGKIGKKAYKAKVKDSIENIHGMKQLGAAYAKDWKVYFQVDSEFTDGAVLGAVKYKLEEIYKDESLAMEARYAALTSFKELQDAKDNSFNLRVAGDISKRMETILTGLPFREEEKIPFIKQAPEFLRNLGQLEHRGQSEKISEEFLLSTSNSWIRKLQTSASRELKEGVQNPEALNSLRKISAQNRAPDWTVRDAEKSVEHLEKLQKHLKSRNPKTWTPGFSRKPVRDELVDGYWNNPADRELFGEPTKLRERSEEEISAYLERAAKRNNPAAVKIGSTMSEIKYAENSAQIESKIAEVLKEFNPRRPTTWLTFFTVIAKRAQSREVFIESLQQFEKPLFEIIKQNHGDEKVQQVAEAVDEFITEAGMPRRLRQAKPQAQASREPPPLQEFSRNKKPAPMGEIQHGEQPTSLREFHQQKQKLPIQELRQPPPAGLSPTSALSESLKTQPMLGSAAPRPLYSDGPKLGRMGGFRKTGTEAEALGDRYPPPLDWQVTSANKRNPLKMDPAVEAPTGHRLRLPPPQQPSDRTIPIKPSLEPLPLNQPRNQRPVPTQLTQFSRVKRPLEAQGEYLQGSEELAKSKGIIGQGNRIPHSPESRPGSVATGFTGPTQAHRLPLPPNARDPSREIYIGKNEFTNPSQLQQTQKSFQGGKSIGLEKPTDFTTNPAQITETLDRLQGVDSLNGIQKPNEFTNPRRYSGIQKPRDFTNPER